MHYHLSFLRSTEQLLQISLKLQCEAGFLDLCMPRWRPGRYTKQSYVKFLADFQAEDQEGNALEWSKTNTHTWRMLVPKAGEVLVRYLYFANQKDAGGSYLDDQLVYLNPITFLLYQPGKEAESCSLSWDLPEGYLVGGALHEQSLPITFRSFHEMVDSPIIASAKLQHEQLTVDGLDIHLWIQGHHTLKIPQLQQEILRYSESQVALFGDCPVSVYHYLYLFWPHDFRHGVEHHNSTVIVMGPGLSMNHPQAHKSLLGISSHEFFHTWNVKALRPADMQPYDYGRENYSRLHYITEGVTTYYGDLMLWKSGIWNWDQWVESINSELDRHYSMAGKDHISLEAASFDSWVNGYDTTGIPHRRISFYTKGYLVAMITDFVLRTETQGRQSLDDVMFGMYQEIAKAGRGYTAADYLTRLEEIAGMSLEEFAQALLAGTAPLEPWLAQMAAAAGMRLFSSGPPDPVMAHLGLSTKSLPGGSLEVESIWPESPLAAMGLYPGDELLAINGHRLRDNLDQWLLTIPTDQPLTLTVVHHEELRTLTFFRAQHLISSPCFVSMIDPDAAQLAHRNDWQRIGGAARVNSATIHSHRRDL